MFGNSIRNSNIRRNQNIRGKYPTIGSKSKNLDFDSDSDLNFGLDSDS